MGSLIGHMSFLSIHPKQVFQKGFEFSNGIATVRNTVFFLMIQLGGGLIQGRDIEDRIIAAVMQGIDNT
jgi:hypothetical protein